MVLKNPYRRSKDAVFEEYVPRAILRSFEIKPSASYRFLPSMSKVSQYKKPERLPPGDLKFNVETLENIREMVKEDKKNMKTMVIKNDVSPWRPFLHLSDTRQLIGLDAPKALYRSFLEKDRSSLVGCVVSGNIGCGKSSMIRLMTKELGYQVVYFNPDTKNVGASESNKYPRYMMDFKRFICTTHIGNPVAIIDHCVVTPELMTSFVDSFLRMNIKIPWVIILDDSQRFRYNSFIQQFDPEILHIKINPPSRELAIEWTRLLPKFNNDTLVKKQTLEAYDGDMKHLAISLSFQEFTGYKDSQIGSTTHDAKSIMCGYNRKTTDKYLRHVGLQYTPFVFNNYLQVNRCSYENTDKSGEDELEMLDKLALGTELMCLSDTMMYESSIGSDAVGQLAIETLSCNFKFGAKYRPIRDDWVFKRKKKEEEVYTLHKKKYERKYPLPVSVSNIRCNKDLLSPKIKNKFIAMHRFNGMKDTMVMPSEVPVLQEAKFWKVEIEKKEDSNELYTDSDDDEYSDYENNHDGDSDGDSDNDNQVKETISITVLSDAFKTDILGGW